MSNHGPIPGTRRARAAIARWFFAYFFRLLLGVVSLSEWVVAWWMLRLAAVPVPAALWIPGPAGAYAMNWWLAARTQRRRRSRSPVGGLPKLYYAVAFTCLFCALFLVLTAAAWASAKLMVGAIAAEARANATTGLLNSSVDGLFHGLANAGMAGIALAFGYGYTVGQWRLRVRTLRLRLPQYPPALDGLRIVQISDIHIGQNLEPVQLERFVARVNALAPDLICITGDIIDSPGADLAGFLPILARVRAPHGVFAILGNHDHYAGADYVEAGLRQWTPFTLLRDQHTSVTINDTPLHIIGLDDHGRDWARGKTRIAELDVAFRTVPPGEPVLLLCHRPDAFVHAAACGIGLMLAGHTHGGQIGVPWLNGRVRNLAEFITRFDRGLFERNGCYLYVNCGLGVTGQRIRLNTPREITVIEVDAAAAQAA